MASITAFFIIVAVCVTLSLSTTLPPPASRLVRVLVVIYDDAIHFDADDDSELNLPTFENVHLSSGSIWDLEDEKSQDGDMIMEYDTDVNINEQQISETFTKFEKIVPSYLSKNMEEEVALAHPMNSVTDRSDRSPSAKKTIKTQRPTGNHDAEVKTMANSSFHEMEGGISTGLRSILLLLAGTFKLRIFALHRNDVSSHTFRWPSGVAVIGILGAGGCGVRETVVKLARQHHRAMVWLAPFPCPSRRQVLPESTGQEIRESTSENFPPSSNCSLRTTLPLYTGKGEPVMRCTHRALHQWLSRVVSRRLYPLTLEKDFRRCLEKSLAAANSINSDTFRVSSKLHKSNDTPHTSGLIMDDILEDNMMDEAQLEEGRRYLNGRTLTIVTINRPPFVILTMGGDEEKEIVGATGFCIEMLQQLAAKYNFTYHLVLPDDGNWGSPVENGTFNGMVGMVNRTEVDFAVASFTITEVRERAIDFTHAYYEEPTTILIPSPKERTNIIAFLAPFSWQVWLCIAGSVFVVSPILWFMTAHFPSLPLLYPHHEVKQRPSLFRYFWSCGFSLTTQDTEMIETEPTRLLHGMWWIFSITIIYSYTGNLIAFLTVPKLENLVNSLEELSLQREVLWTYRKNTAHDVLFGFAKPPGTYSRIGDLLDERPELKVNTDDEGISSVLDKNMAFIKEKSWLDFAMEKDYLKTGECRFSQVPQIFFSAGFGWCLQTKSPYLPLVNREILRMTQSGLFAKWRLMYWPRPNECTAGGQARSVKPLQLWNFTGHFLLLGLGCVTSFLVFLLERVVSRVTDEGPKEGERRRADERREKRSNLQLGKDIMDVRNFGIKGGRYRQLYR